MTKIFALWILLAMGSAAADLFLIWTNYNLWTKIAAALGG